MIKNIKEKCPLCGSHLSNKKYNDVTGIYAEKERMIKEANDKININKKKLKELKKNMEDEFKKKLKQERIKEADIQHKKEVKQKKQYEKALESIKDLKDQVKNAKRGINEIDVGFEYERALYEMLVKAYPEDNIKLTGKVGDVLHIIMDGKRKVGSIVYECKRTKRHMISHVNQALEAQLSRNSNFAVLVTTGAITKRFNGFDQQKGVCITRFEATLFVSELLRSRILDMDEYKFNEKKKKESSKELMNYICSSEYKSVVTNALRSIDDEKYRLDKEIQYHISSWKKHAQFLFDITNRIGNISENSKRAINGKEIIKYKKKNNGLSFDGQKLTIKL